MNIDELIHKGFVGKFLETPTDSAIIFYGLLIGVPLLCAVIGYFLGCLNFGIIISKLKFHEDIRSKGSGNAGATNMLRTYGTGIAAATFLGDLLKSVVATSIGLVAFGGIGGFIGAFACMVGHAFPCIYGFKGGKGVAVSAGAIFVLDWRIGLILLAVFIIVVWGTKFISLGSVIVFFLFPILMARLDIGRMPAITVVFAFMMAALGIYLHRENIKRIYNGTENKVSFKSKKSKSEEDTDGSADE